jgi:FkbM family methyltransferase
MLPKTPMRALGLIGFFAISGLPNCAAAEAKAEAVEESCDASLGQAGAAAAGLSLLQLAASVIPNDTKALSKFAVSSVHLGKESTQFLQSRTTQLDAHQYFMQVGAATAIHDPEETCNQLHDPNICDEATGKCVASINNLLESGGVPVDSAGYQVGLLSATVQVGPLTPAQLTDAAQSFWQPFKMVTFQNDVYVSRLSICHGKSWENEAVLDFMQGSLQGKKGWNFLDVGANLGSWTLPVALNAKARGGRVISVEADPQTSAALSESVVMNSLSGDVSLVQKAVVRDSKATTSICMSAGDVANEANIGGNQAELGSRRLEERVCGKEVPTTTLDDLYASDPAMMNVAAMKLDCEGCEGGAIMGAHKFLTEKPPCFIAMEITEGYLCDSDTPLKDVKDFLHNHGYDVSSITGPHGGDSCEEYKAFENAHGLLQEFVQLGRRDAADAAGCLARFQDMAAVL